MERVEQEEKELSHFSHEEHPLILSQVEKKQNVKAGGFICYGCQEQILEPQAYICRLCDFFLHKKCAKLPRQITHPMHSQHPLVLHKTPSYYIRSKCFCNACGRGWKFFTYHCSLCEFDLDVLCSNMERRFDHKGHEHPLIYQNSHATFYCSACRRKNRDSSYFCSTCPFWIHKACASLPDSVYHKHHLNHPLSQAYGIPYELRRFNRDCSDCQEQIDPTHWVFHCGPCRYYIHLECLRPTNKREGELAFEDDEQILEKKLLVNLPMEDPTPNLLSRRFPQKTEASMLHPAHNHMLVLSEGQPTQNEEIIICGCGGGGGVGGGQTILSCEGCIEPIMPSDPHYKCTSCNYFLHVACQNLTTTQLQIPKLHYHPLALDTTVNVAIGTVCDVCWGRCNGFSYTCSACPSFHVCVKCLAAAFHSRVVHKAHNHILNRTNYLAENCNACGYFIGTDLAFYCECWFYLHWGCCLLPPTVKHKWDKHLLILMFPPYFEHPNEFYCKICEEEMDPNLWMYHCRECDQSFHLYCLPQFKFRNMKLGRNLLVEDHPDDHPLMIISISQRNYKSFCKDCGASLHEGLAFECIPCRFYLCMACAERRKYRKKKKSIAITSTQAAGASGDSESNNDYPKEAYGDSRYNAS